MLACVCVPVCIACSLVYSLWMWMCMHTSQEQCNVYVYRPTTMQSNRQHPACPLLTPASCTARTAKPVTGPDIVAPPTPPSTQLYVCARLASATPLLECVATPVLSKYTAYTPSRCLLTADSATRAHRTAGAHVPYSPHTLPRPHHLGRV